jgi:hypothetical protein
LHNSLELLLDLGVAYGTVFDHAEVSPDSKPSEKRTG